LNGCNSDNLQPSKLDGPAHDFVVSGLRQSLELAGEPGHWIILSRGTVSEGESYISREQADILRSRPEIATGSSGAVLFSPEMVVPFNAAVKRPANQFKPASLRGVSPIAYKMRGGLTLVAGRWPEQGRDEMAIGQKQAARFPELSVGTTFKYGRRTWTIVGIFADRGSALESEFWTDIDVLQQDARFEHGYSSFHVVLRPGTEDTFRNALVEDARLTVDALSEHEFFAEQAKVADRLREMVLIVGLIVGTGARLQPRVGADLLPGGECDSRAGGWRHRRAAGDFLKLGGWPE
jgi:putative ABC transport system permease protein